jgi:hypothetical protein
MTAAGVEKSGNTITIARVGKVISEIKGTTPEESASQIEIEWKNADRIFSNLTIGIDVTRASGLECGRSLCCPGMKLHGMGFLLKPNNIHLAEGEVVFPYLNGRDLLQISRNLSIIDLYPLAETEAAHKYPRAYQWIYENVKPKRDTNRDMAIRENWWLYGRTRPDLRDAIQGLERYITTVETSKHEVFIFLDSKVIPDNKLICIALEDAYFLGILSSKIHSKWALAAGGRLGVGNDPVYSKTTCFDPFPFPDPAPEQKQKIRELGDRLDTHRKQVQAAHPEITITGMYNLLEKLRSGQPFTDADREYNNKALVSTLKQIHDELDAAVLEAYGWQDLVAAQQAGKPAEEINETILERLIALNAERAAEERNGLIRWLRPEYQAPGQVKPTQTTLEGIATEEETVIEPVEQQKWPTQPKAQLAAIRDLLRTSNGEWTVAQIASQFTGRNTQKKLDAITENLERLEWFGLLIRREESGISYWHYAELQQTA